MSISKLTVAIAVVVALQALPRREAAAEKVMVAVPDRTEFDVAYSSLDETGLTKHTAAFGQVGIHYHIGTRKSDRAPGFAFWDLYSLRVGIGGMLSDPAPTETGTTLEITTGYRLLVGMRTGSMGIFGGLGAEYGLVWIRDAQLGGFSIPVAAHADFKFGERYLDAEAWAGFLGGRKTYGANVKLPLTSRWGVFFSGEYLSSTHESADVTGFLVVGGVRRDLRAYY